MPPAGRGPLLLIYLLVLFLSITNPTVTKYLLKPVIVVIDRSDKVYKHGEGEIVKSIC